MYYPTTRVLTVLELLQSHRSLTGVELARRLEVDERTTRRYIAMLGELGIPVIADRGRNGGYRLMPGFKLPPLMLSEDEALALTLGLLAARRLGLATHAPGVEAALAKVERVLPERVRERVRAVEETLVWDAERRPARDTPDTGVVLSLGAAARERRQVVLRYRRTDGEESERAFDPYGLVCRRGRWYATGHCHLRAGLRLFRLDRIASLETGTATFARPTDFDVLGEVLKALGSVPRAFPVEVLLHGVTLERARWHLAAEAVLLEEADCGVLLRGYTDNPDWLARRLAAVGCPLEIRDPPELRDALTKLAQQLAGWAATAEEAPRSHHGNRCP